MEDEQEEQFQRAFSDFERAGLPNVYMGEKYFGGYQGMLPKEMFMTGCQRYQALFASFFPKMNFQLNEIDSLVSKVQRVEYKNPLAFLFGYYCINKDGSIDKKRINECLSNTQKIVDNHASVTLKLQITCNDIIRYARYILSIQK